MKPETQLDLLKVRWCDLALAQVHALPPGREFTADDLHTLIPAAPAHPNHFGALTAKARKAELIERVGYRVSLRPQRNGAELRLWRRKGADGDS